jgi:hypothetical protein
LAQLVDALPQLAGELSRFDTEIAALEAGAPAKVAN